MTDESTDPALKPVEETLNYDAELEKLNTEFSQEQQEQPKPEAQTEIAELTAKLERVESVVHADQMTKTVTDAVSAVKGGNDLSISDKMLERVVVGEVSNNPVAMKAYMNREQNPGAWSKYLGLLGKEVAKDFGKEKTAETSDLEAVEAAVRGQTDAPTRKTVSTKDVGNMTPAEYRAWQKEALA